jgi:hypothetical protein
MFDSPKVIRAFQALFLLGMLMQFPSWNANAPLRTILGVVGFLMLVAAYEIRYRRLRGGKLRLQSPVAVENTLLGIGVVVILSKNFGF